VNTNALKKFATDARRRLIEQVGTKLEYVLNIDTAELREKAKQIRELQRQIDASSKLSVIERVAYTWFNRFMALRFMDANGYTTARAVSPVEGHTLPEILAEAKRGNIETGLKVDQRKINDLLDGRIGSQDPQTEVYKLLLVAVCNSYNAVMPFMFEAISDYTELLMPDDLLGDGSILNDFVTNMTDEDCRNVEVVGWLYQFYISEKKDEVMARKKAVPKEDIPAVTQLFTPHWIVRYLVANSLGRLWMLNRPNSRLRERMEYYIEPEEKETDFLRISSPEEIKICDPACGSGHMLVYAFDLLYAIYEEEGYDPPEIPRLILEKNLYGIEIDERAGELAAFALFMKARENYRRFFKNPVQPNICVLENIKFEDEELETYMDKIGRDLFTADLQETLHQFEEADNFGSLIRPELTDVRDMLRIMGDKDVGGDLLLHSFHERVLQTLEQADYLSPKYHVVVTNPPYMGGGMNPQLKEFARKNYPDSKSDLFAMFIDRNLDLIRPNGLMAMITMQSWMFLSSFEKLRQNLLSRDTILSMAHLGPRAFDSIGGEVVQTTAFVIRNRPGIDYKGIFLRLIEGRSEKEKSDQCLEAIANPDCGWFFHSAASDFKKIPGSPIAYWMSNKQLSLFGKDSFADKCYAGFGIKTGNNALFMRLWSEVSYGSIEFLCEGKKFNFKWYPCASGGPYRKWYGNQELIVNYHFKGRDIEEYAEKNGNSFGFNGQRCYFRRSITWPKLASGTNSFRSTPPGHIFDGVGLSAFFDSETDYKLAILCLNSRIIAEILSIIAPTLSLTSGDFLKLPFLQGNRVKLILADRAILSSKKDWNSFETSWDFTIHPLIQSDYRQSTLNETYNHLRTYWSEMTEEMQKLEEENNRIFIETYGFQDELMPDVPLKEITLTCNPHYRYGGKKTVEELEDLLLADTMREFISYAVGCMLGRYSLDKPGLILANQGETLKDYLKQVTNPTFMPDDDNVIPVLDDEYFTDDIVGRFKKFLRVTFGDDHYDENLAFIESAIGKDIRKYFLNDFYNHHVKIYKKRPIYWLFSSPKKSFNVLIYMHRYRPDTVSRILNEYLREFQEKLRARKINQQEISISESASTSEKSKANRELARIDKVLAELDDYERNVLFPLAGKKIEIDLDDGVKMNYNKFGNALRKIPGLSGK